jgi:tetratricopeptide (TPR) repeat protein
VIFYSTTNNWGNPEAWNEANVVLRTTVKEEALQKPVESFTIGISNLTADSADLDMAWENSSVSMKFEVPTQKVTLANIEKILAGPTSADYFSAAQYIYQSNGDNAKALNYVDKALDMSTEKPYWYTRLKSLIQAKLGDKKGAVETANISLVAAETVKNQDYVKMNRESIAEWSKK